MRRGPRGTRRVTGDAAPVPTRHPCDGNGAMFWLARKKFSGS